MGTLLSRSGALHFGGDVDYFGTILEILKAGLNIWSSKESDKYLKMILDLEKRASDEKNKPIYVKGMDVHGNYRSDLVLNNLLRELCTIGRGFAAASRANVSKDLP